MIALGETQRRWMKRIGYPLLGVVVFVFAVHYTFPYGRLEQKLQDWAGDNYEVSVSSIEPGWIPGRVVMKGVTFKSRPDKPGDKATEFTLDEVDLNIGLMAAIGGTYKIDLAATIGVGKFTGKVVAGKKEARLRFHSSELPLDNLPGVKSGTGGVPIKGGLNADIDVTLPKGKWKEAQGTIEISCDSCTIGDGIAKVRPMAQAQKNAMSSEGFTLPKLKLGKIGGKIEIVKGIGTFVDFAADSTDGELTLEGNIRFDDPFTKSQVTAYMRFKSSDELKKREPKMDDIEKFMGGQARRPDGYLGVSITGPLSGLRYLGAKVSPVPTNKEKTTTRKPPPAAAAKPPDVKPTPPTAIAPAEEKTGPGTGNAAVPVAPVGVQPVDIKPAIDPANVPDGDKANEQKERNNELRGRGAAAEQMQLEAGQGHGQQNGQGQMPPPGDETQPVPTEPPHDTDPDQPAQPNPPPEEQAQPDQPRAQD